MDPRLYSVVDGSGVYRTGAQTTADGVDLATAFYADVGSLPPCHQLRSPRTASVVDGVESTPNPVSRDFVARAFYDGGGGRGAVAGPPVSFWERRRASFLPDTMAPGVIGGYDGSTGLAAADTRSCRRDSIGSKDTAAGAPGCSASSVSSASVTSSMTSSSSSLSRKKKPIGRNSDFDPFFDCVIGLLATKPTSLFMNEPHHVTDVVPINLLLCIYFVNYS